IYKLFNKKLKKINTIKLLSFTFFINILYLMFFNFSDPEILPYGNRIWKGATWGTFPAWIFYFAVGYCSGRNIKQLNKRLDKYKNLIFPSAIIFGGSLAYMYLSGSLSENSSKRFDMILFSTSMFLLIYYIGTKINNTPRFFKFISRYSFGIFLFHMIYLYLSTYLFTEFFYIKLNPFLTLVLLVISSTILSIFTTYFLDKTSYGTLLIGKLEKPKN
ncbi:MAG: acyltransferase family protein, partial [Bacillota bacterium]